jgi:hypothetical protein
VIIEGVGFNGFAGVGELAPTFTGLMGKVTATGMEGVMVNTALVGLEGLTTTVTTSAINSFNLDSKGNLGWSGDAFKSQFDSGLISMAGSMVNTFTNGSLGQVNLFDGNGIGLTDTIFNRSGIESFNRFAGGLAGQGMEFALGGDFTMNLLNTNMFGLTNKHGNAVNTGLFEMSFGRDGMNIGLGMGGMDASYGAIAGAMSGLSDAFKIGNAKFASQFGRQQSLSTLNAINMLGYTSSADNHMLGKSVWSGKTKAKYAELGDNEYGRYDSNNPAEILLNSGLVGMGREEAAKLASVMAHEGSHAGGNNFEAIAHEQGLGTYVELLSGFGLAGDTTMVGSMIDALMDPNSYVANSGDVQNWKVTKDKNGNILKIENDNSNNITFVDERGNVTDVSEYTGGSRSGFIANQLGLQNGSAANEMLRNAGYTYNAETGLFEGENAKQAFDITGQTELSIGPVEKGNWFTNSMISIGNGIKAGFSTAKGAVNALYNTAVLWYNAIAMDVYISDFEKVPGDSLSFWNEIMTPSEAKKYSEGNNNGIPQCNNYIGDKIKATYGDEMYSRIFPNGMETANNLSKQFADNPNLQRIDTSQYSIEQIQAMANKGALIIMSYKNPNPQESGHAAFVANSGVGLFSVPATYLRSDGTEVAIPQSGYGYNQTSKNAWPILSQAGSITGSVTMGWGTNDWNNEYYYESDPYKYTSQGYNSYREFLLDNYISFYMIKRGY